MPALPEGNCTATSAVIHCLLLKISLHQAIVCRSSRLPHQLMALSRYGYHGGRFQALHGNVVPLLRPGFGQERALLIGLVGLCGVGLLREGDGE